MGNYKDLSADLQRALTDVVLLRGECLAALGSLEEAEVCAHFAFHKRPSDVSVVSRAAAIVRKDHPHNDEIKLQMFKVVYLMTLIRECIRKRTKARRVRMHRRLHRAATSIISFIRMVLERNRTAGDIIGGMGIICATRRARRLLHYKQVLRTGFEQVQAWFQVTLNPNPLL
jgi:hypothetical protein